MKKIVVVAAISAALFAPAAVAGAAPSSQAPEVTLVADSGSSSGSGAAQALCLVLKMIRIGSVDSSGGGPACTF
ncbi:hypothetical protein [Nocardia sp. XZ_19_385]|uniref:hypothetical protein n=1 Tax=Nocardia sp. XZ_19_385 TaxID=2769488 RepID=UPI00188E1A9A|nr:hypothetical protein [Nocardia sp. XZ_19_385]